MPSSAFGSWITTGVREAEQRETFGGLRRGANCSQMPPKRLKLWQKTNRLQGPNNSRYLCNPCFSLLMVDSIIPSKSPHPQGLLEPLLELQRGIWNVFLWGASSRVLQTQHLIISVFKAEKKKVVKVSGVQSHEAQGCFRHISHDGQGLPQGSTISTVFLSARKTLQAPKADAVWQGCH